MQLSSFERSRRMPSIDSPVVGIWQLLSVEMHRADNPHGPPVRLPLGSNVLGRIIFTPDGFMSGLLTSKDSADPKKLSKKWASAPDAEIASIARSLVAYCGYYRLYEEDGVPLIVVDIDISLDPTWIGGPQVRRWNVREEGGKTTMVLQPVKDLELPVRLPRLPS